ncbi:MAG: RDD family protein [Cytophagales bacterium]|nr:RDD family protein [Cytophagales bacterium]
MSLLMTLWIAIGACVSFVVVYLALNFFQKQDFITAKLSQRLLAFILDMLSLNAIVLVLFLVFIIREEDPRTTVTNYVLLVQEQTSIRFWYDFRYVQTWVIVAYGLYSIIGEWLYQGTLGRIRMDLRVSSAKYEENTKVSLSNIIIRNVIKTVSLGLVLLYFGLFGWFVLLAAYYIVYKIGLYGRLPHDYLAQTRIIREDEEKVPVKMDVEY